MSIHQTSEALSVSAQAGTQEEGRSKDQNHGSRHTARTRDLIRQFAVAREFCKTEAEMLSAVKNGLEDGVRLTARDDSGLSVLDIALQENYEIVAQYVYDTVVKSPSLTTSQKLDVLEHAFVHAKDEATENMLAKGWHKLRKEALAFEKWYTDRNARATLMGTPSRSEQASFARAADGAKWAKDLITMIKRGRESNTSEQNISFTVDAGIPRYIDFAYKDENGDTLLDCAIQEQYNQAASHIVKKLTKVPYMTPEEKMEILGSAFIHLDQVKATEALRADLRAAHLEVGKVLKVEQRFNLKP